MKQAMLWDDRNDKLIFKGPAVNTAYDSDAEDALRCELIKKHIDGLLKIYPVLVEEVEDEVH